MPALTQDHFVMPAAPAADSRSLADSLAVLGRWRRLALWVFAAVMLLALLVAFGLSAVYRSSATILIKEQEIPQEMVRSTVTSFADERIQVISQQVMTRATLLELVQRHDLYARDRRRETNEEILERMRRDIKLVPISAEVTDRRTGSPAKATIAFTLMVDSESPAHAQKIANELTSLFLNENVKNRQQKAAETTSFLDEELERVSAHISELESKVADWKRRNQGRTPELSQSNLQGSERAEIELQRVERELAQAGDRRQQLAAQLADTRATLPLAAGNGAPLEPDDRLRALRTQLATLSGSYSDSHPDVRRLRREIASLEAEVGSSTAADDHLTELDRQRAELALLRKRYGEDHPDVVRLRRSVEGMQVERAGATASGAAVDPARTRKPDNPTWIALKAQVAATQSQLDSLSAERRELRSRVGQLASRLTQSPEVEREYLQMARDLDSSRMRFKELRDKQLQAQVAEQLERGRKAERFTVIEPPVYPERPQRPNRALLLALGAVLAVVSALAAVALAHALDDAVHGPREVVRLMQVPVLAILPPLRSQSERARLRSWQWRLGGSALVGLTVVAMVFYHFGVMPLDVAWYGLLRRLAV